MSITTHGLLLQSIPYLGQKKILKIFTPEQGLIALFANHTQLAPFCLAEWVYRKTQNEVHSIQDSTLLDPLAHLRANYNALTAAGAIAQGLLQTQVPDKRAAALFALALFYLRKLAVAPEMLVSSFLLKLLLHEGLFSAELDPIFTPPEWDQVCILAFSRKLPVIQNLTAAPHSKIKKIFGERLESL